jgi:hypothetical protein
MLTTCVTAASALAVVLLSSCWHAKVAIAGDKQATAERQMQSCYLASSCRTSLTDVGYTPRRVAVPAPQHNNNNMQQSSNTQ